MKWTKTSEVYDDETSYSFKAWRLDKEFFASGPSLFDWHLTKIDDPSINEFFSTKRQATRFVREHDPNTSALNEMNPAL